MNHFSLSRAWRMCRLLLNISELLRPRSLVRISILISVCGGIITYLLARHNAFHMMAIALHICALLSTVNIATNALLTKNASLQLLTLPATGSEMNNGAVVSRKEFNEKLAFHNPNGYPRFSVLDPEVCYSLPQRQVINGIVDSFAHTLEQYLTFNTQSMVMDRWAEGLLQTLVELGPKLVERHDRYEDVANFMLTATMALNGFIAMGVPQDWATHMIGHELTALHGLDHGVTLAIVYPGMMRVMRREKFDKLVQYAERVWGATGTPDEKVEAAITKTDEFFRSLGMKTRLSEHCVGQDTIDFIVERFRKRGWNLGESGQVTPERVSEILKDRL